MNHDRAFVLNGNEASRRPEDRSATICAPSLVSWWRMADFGIFGLWLAIVGFTIQHHEKWADEGQAWLLARDLDLGTLWFHELRYEGSPGLWHTVLWMAQRVFHASYGSISYIGMAFAAGGAATVLFKAPFPRALRWLLIFSYFLIYQYAVIARPYTLLPLLAFVATSLFKDIRRPVGITVVLVLLANVSIHGTILASCLGLAYLIDGIKSWASLDSGIRRQYMLCIVAMAITFMFLFVVLRPTSDVEVIAVKRDPAKYHIVQMPKIARTKAILAGAFMDDYVSSAIFFLAAGIWCFIRGRLLPFALPTLLIILFYVFVYGSWQHHGTLFVAAIAGLWIAWPTESEQRAFTVGERRVSQALIVLLACVLSLNVWDAAISIRHEYLYPYSGAEDAANYLKSVGVTGKRIFGYQYGIAGMQPFFDHNILSNISTAYYHHGVPLQGRFLDWNQISAVHPEYIVICSTDPESDYRHTNAGFNANGYNLVHVSEGFPFYKRGVYERQTYLIYRRMP